MIYFVVPARAGSVRFPNKNEILFPYILPLLKLLKREYKESQIIINSNIDKLFAICKVHNFIFYRIADNKAGSNSIIKNYMKDMIDGIGIKKNDLIVMLYLTYPERNIFDIARAINFFNQLKAKSLLCRKEIKGAHPCLFMYQSELATGKQVIKHNFSNSQDYPKVFEISHFISIFYAGEIKKLNNNLYNDKTVFHWITTKMDIDTKEDYVEFLRHYKK